MITLKELLEKNWKVENRSKEPGYEWFMLSFEVPAKTPADAEAQMIALREELAQLQKTDEQRSEEALKGLNELCDVIEKHQKDNS